MEAVELLESMKVFGHCEIKTFYQLEGARLVSYGYSIDYDREGKEVSRTKPSPLGSIYFSPPKKHEPWWKKLWRGSL